MSKDRPITPFLIGRFAAYRTLEPAWGSLHIVLDDDNVHDSHVMFVGNYALDHDDDFGADLAAELGWMSKSQRSRVDRLVDAHLRVNTALVVEASGKPPVNVLQLMDVSVFYNWDST